MKTLTVFFALSLSLSSFAAGIDTIKNVLDQRDVEELETKLAERGFALSNVTDRYAQNGVRPRCICESFELSFTKYNAGGNKVEKYAIGLTGFGTNQKVTSIKSNNPFSIFDETGGDFSLICQRSGSSNKILIYSFPFQGFASNP